MVSRSQEEEVGADAGEAGALGGGTWKFLPDVFVFHFSKNVSWPCQSSSHWSLCFTEESTSSKTSRASEQLGPRGRFSASAVLRPLPLRHPRCHTCGAVLLCVGSSAPAPLVCRLLALEFLQDLYLDTLCHTCLRLFGRIHSLS